MSEGIQRRLLFAVALVTLPLPFYLGDVEISPVLRLAFLSSLFAAVAIAEGGGTIAALGLLGAVQTFFAIGVVWVLSVVVIRTLERLPVPALRSAMWAAVLLGLVASSFFEIYTTSLSSTRPRSSLLHLFE